MLTSQLGLACETFVSCVFAKSGGATVEDVASACFWEEEEEDYKAKA
jgi:hypothetical protein